MSDKELTKAIYEAMQVPYLSERHDAIKQLITTDRKRVALEARLDENEHNLRLIDNKYGDGEVYSLADSGMYDRLRLRIAELKAKQEEL